MTKHYTDEGTLLIRNSDIKDGKFEFGDNPIYLEKTFAEKNETRMHQIGDVITVHTGDVGTSAVITENEAKSIGFATIVTRPNPKIIDSNYLCSFLNTDKHKKWAVSISTGDGRTNYNLGDYFELVVPVPSIAEQKRIASYIQKLNRLITLHQREFVFLCKEKIEIIRYIKNTWEQRKFSDLVQIERGGSPRPIDDFITDSPDGLNWVKIGDAPAQGNYITKTAEKIKPEGLSKTREVHPGDLILSNSMSFGKPYIMGIDGCIHDGWLLIRNTYKVFDLTFLCHLLGTPQMIIQYKSLAAGSTVNNLNKELVGNTVVTIPTIKEQRVLGQYLETLDNLITLHQRKYDKLTNVKKSMLGKMFPQNGSNVPEIRFKGFTEAWEQRKVGDLLIERNQQAPMSDEYPLMAFIANEGVAPKGDRYDRSALVTDTANKLYKKTEIGDFIYSSNNLETGSIGLNKYGKACISPVYSIFEPTGIADSDFLGRRLVRKDFINAMVKWRQGVIYGQWRIHESDFLKIEIPVPSVVEQRKIGAYLDQLDRLITLHQRELEKLKNLSDTWEQRKFDEVFDCTIPNNTLSRAELNYESGSVRNIHYGDILIKYGSVVDVQNDEIPFATGKSSDDFKGALLRDGDIIIADTAEDETTGKACEIGNSQGLDVVSGLHTMVCRPRNKMALGYLGYYLNSDAYHHQLLPLMQGIKVLSLSRTNVQKTMVCYPKSKAEQQLIADCFRNLDNLITLHQCE